MEDAKLVEAAMGKSNKIRALAELTGTDYAIALLIADSLHPRNAGKAPNHWHIEARTKFIAAKGEHAYEAFVHTVGRLLVASGVTTG